MIWIQKIKENVKNTKNAFRRFPVSMALSFVAAYFLMKGIRGGDSTVTIPQICTSIFAFFMGILCQLITESFQGSKTRIRTLRLITFAMGILGVALIYFALQGYHGGDPFRYQIGLLYFGSLFGIITACLFVGRMNRWENFEYYVLDIFTGEIIALVYSAVLYLGIIAVGFSVNELFGISLGNYFYGDVFFLVFAPFHAGIFLAGFPEGDRSYSGVRIDKVFRVLLLYIITPLLFVYALILMAYFVKLLLHGEMPVNLISDLTLWFGVIAVGDLFFLSRLKEDDFAVKTFRYFPYVLLPLLAMFFYALSRRIGEYGFTVNRYLGLLLGIWIALSIGYMMVKKGKDNLAIAVFLCLFILIATIGPLNAFNVAKNSQLRRLNGLLVDAGLMQEGKVNFSGKTVSDKDKVEITSILVYLTNHYETKDIPLFPEGFSMNEMESFLGFAPKYPEGNSDFFNFFHDYEGDVVDITGLNRMISVNLYSMKEEKTLVSEEFTFNLAVDALEISRAGETEPFIRLPLEEIMKKIDVLDTNGEGSNPVEFTGETETMRWKLVIISFSLDKSNFSADTSVDFQFFVGDKVMPGTFTPTEKSVKK